MPAWLEEFIGGFVGDLFYGPFYKLAEVVWITLMDLSLGVIGKTPSQFSPSYGPFYKLAEVVWITLMDLSLGVIGKTPSQFSPSAWSYVAHTLYPWTLGIGLSMVNVFFICSFLKAVSNLKEQVTLELFIEGMIRLVAVNVLFQMGIGLSMVNVFFICSFLKAVSNLKEQVTLELFIEGMIRLVAVNVLFQMGFNLMKTFFSMASAMSGEIIDFQGPPLFTEEVDIGSHLFWWLFGLLYFLVALVCGIMIFLTLYSRYIKLYMLVVCFPLAMPSLISGRGIDETAKAWLRNFLGNAFEVVVIALVISISGKIIGGFNLPESSFADFFDGFGQALKLRNFLGNAFEVVVIALVISISGKIIGGFNLPESSFADFFDGFGQALKSLIYMIGMTGAVKGANNFMNKTFHL